jgi:ABC-2 type transport system ATP-binding protein
MSMIEITDLTKQYGETVAVDHLSFTAREGAITGFLGPNGAGKTTTLRMLLGLAEPTSGTATIGGRRYASLQAPTRQVGAVLESTGFHPGRRARDHLRILAVSAGLPPTRVDSVLEDVGLADVGRRRVKDFSLGMRQRLGLASALLGEPRVLILDEPTNGLDPEGVHWLRGFLRRFAADGGTVVVSSHLLAEVSQTVDDVVIIAHGRLIAQSPLADLAMQAPSGIRVRTPQAAELRGRLAAREIASEQLGTDSLVAYGTTTEEVAVAAAAAGIALYEISAQHADLEDLFLQLTSTAGGIR